MSEVDFVDDIDPKSFVKNTKKAVVLNLDYYHELKEKADKLDEKETPKEVVDEDGITFSCPTCYADNSKWIDWSMLQRQPKRAKVCQECGQKLKWV